MFERFNGNVVPFADESTSTNRTVFGSETQSDDIDDNLNADFKKGWEIVGLNDNPTREDFNAMGYTLGYLTSYLYQNGVAEYNLLQEYKTNSIAIGTDGNIYQSLVDNNIGNALSDTTKWVCIASKNSIVNSIAELKTISNIESINVLGYYEKGDGGGGTFYWDATSTETDNGGTIIQATDITTGRWKRVFSGAVNVKWFGAKGDGVTDDTVAIQNAIDNHNDIYFSSGTYYSTDTLIAKKSINIVGENAILKAEMSKELLALNGKILSQTTLASSVEENSYEFLVTDTTNITKGSFLILRSTVDDSWVGKFGTENRNYKKQDIVVVDDITLNTITLANGIVLGNSFTQSETEILIIEPISVFISGITLDSSNIDMSSGLSLAYCKDSVVSNVKSIGADIIGIGCASSYNTLFEKCFSSITKEGGTHKYAIAVNSSNNTHVVNCISHSTRHAIAIIGDYQNRNILVNSNTLTGYSPCDAHGCADNLIYSNNIIKLDGYLIFGGRNTSYLNNNIKSTNGLLLMCYETRGGIYILDGNIFETNASTITSGFYPIDLSYGTTGISSDSRENFTFIVENNKIKAPFLSINALVGHRNSSIYKANILINNLSINMPLISYILSYRGSPVNINEYINVTNISHNSTSLLANYIKVDGTISALNQNESVHINKGVITENASMHLTASEAYHRLGNYSYLTSSNASPYKTELKTVGSATSLGEVAITANARYGEIVFYTGFDGTIEPLTSKIKISTAGNFLPVLDNLKSLGGASNRWSTIYAGTGTINTSDDREKTYLEITEVEKQVALELKANMRKFKFNTSIEEKGKDKARIHFGASAQTVKSIFEKYGLDAFDYAILCYDEWEDEYKTNVIEEAELDKKGNIVKEAVLEQVLVRESGNRYGLRYEELLSFIIGCI